MKNQDEEPKVNLKKVIGKAVATIIVMITLKMVLSSYAFIALLVGKKLIGIILNKIG
jgi:hypothetical protein